MFFKIIKIFIWVLYYTFYIIPVDFYKNFLHLLGFSTKEEHDGIEKIGKKIAIFVCYPYRSKITENTKRYISNLKDLGFSIVLISNGSINSQNIEELKKICSKIIIRTNHGRDFGAYKYGLMKYKNEIMASQKLLLVNDSTIPIRKLDDMFSEMEAKNVDLWGVSESYKKMYEDYHICSYFLLMSKNLIKSDAFWEFWKNYKITDSRALTINHGETDFTYKMKGAGFKTASYIDSYKINKFLISNSNKEGEISPTWLNFTLAEKYISSFDTSSIARMLYCMNHNGIFLKIMLKLGMPIIKKDIFSKCVYYVDDMIVFLKEDSSVLYIDETMEELIQGLNKKKSFKDKLLATIGEK
jgi:hypothetical protein